MAPSISAMENIPHRHSTCHSNHSLFLNLVYYSLPLFKVPVNIKEENLIIMACLPIDFKAKGRFEPMGGEETLSLLLCSHSFICTSSDRIWFSCTGFWVLYKDQHQVNLNVPLVKDKKTSVLGNQYPYHLLLVHILHQCQGVSTDEVLSTPNC